MYYTLEVYMQKPTKDKLKLQVGKKDVQDLLKSAEQGGKGFSDAMKNPRDKFAEMLGDKKGEAYIKLEREMIKSVKVHTSATKNVLKTKQHDGNGKEIEVEGEAVHASAMREDIRIEVTGYLYKPNEVYEDTARLLIWAHHAPKARTARSYADMFKKYDEYEALDKAAKEAYKTQTGNDEYIKELEQVKKMWETSTSGTSTDSDWFEKFDSGYRHVILRIKSAAVENFVTPFGDVEDYRLIYLPSAYISSYKETYNVKDGSALFSMMIQQNPDETFGVKILSPKQDKVNFIDHIQTGLNRISEARKVIGAGLGIAAATVGTVEMGMYMYEASQAKEVDRQRDEYEKKLADLNAKEAKCKEAKAKVTAAEDKVAKAQADYDRAAKNGTVPDEIKKALDDAKSERTTAQREYTTAQTALTTAQTACTDAKQNYDKAKKDYDDASGRRKLTNKIKATTSSSGGIAVAFSVNTAMYNANIIDQSFDSKRQERDRKYNAIERVKTNRASTRTSNVVNESRYEDLKNTDEWKNDKKS